MKFHNAQRSRGVKLHLAAMACMAVLAGCGGGGGGSSDDAGSGSGSGSGGSSTSVTLSVVTQPQSVSVPVGQAATFTVAASGSGELTYQWLANGIEIAGATAASYTTAATALSDSGTTYSVRVSDSSGSVLSASVTLTVTSAQALMSPKVQRLSAGNGYVLGVRADGSVLAWGTNMVGGTGTALVGSTAKIITGVSGAVGASASGLASYEQRSLVVTSSGALMGWGASSQGALGVNYTGSTVTVNDAITVSQVSGVVQAVSCNRATYALKNDGTVWLVPGERTSDGVISAIQVQGLSGIDTLVTGESNSSSCDLLALDTAGAAWTVKATPGSYDSTTQRYTWQTTVAQDTVVPAQTKLLSCDRVFLETGVGQHCLAMTADGKLWSWGGNNSGQLGLGDQVTRTVATQFATATGIKKLVAAVNYSFIVGDDGKVYGWGGYTTGNDPMLAGRAGSGDVNYSDFWVPGLIASISGVEDLVVAFTSGGSFVTALKTDGTVWTWGSNAYGVFADGTSGTTSAVPVQAPGISLN